jgi:hypothetical protein
MNRQASSVCKKAHSQANIWAWCHPVLSKASDCIHECTHKPSMEAQALIPGNRRQAPAVLPIGTSIQMPLPI